MSITPAEQLAAERANPFVQITADEKHYWWLGGHEIELSPEYEWRLVALALRLAAAGGLESLRAQEQRLWERYLEQGGDSTWGPVCDAVASVAPHAGSGVVLRSGGRSVTLSQRQMVPNLVLARAARVARLLADPPALGVGHWERVFPPELHLSASRARKCMLADAGEVPHLHFQQFDALQRVVEH